MQQSVKRRWRDYKEGVSLWPRDISPLLNLDQLIFRARLKKCVTPPFFIFMSQQSVSEVPSPLATKAPPWCLCRRAQHMRAICVRTLNFHPCTLPVGSTCCLMIGWERRAGTTKTTPVKKNAFIAPNNSGYVLQSSCVTHFFQLWSF